MNINSFDISNFSKWQDFNHVLKNRKSHLRFVYTHFFKSCDQSVDRTPFGFSNLFRAMQSCVMRAKSCIILKLPKSTVI